MPKIINAYAEGQNSIADSLKSIGQSIWGDEAKNEGLRQNAIKTQREAEGVARKNAGIEAAANAFRGGNFLDYGANSIRGGVTGDIGPAWLAHEANTRGARAPQTQNAWTGAGHAWGGSPEGFEETQAGLDRRSRYSDDRAAKTAEAQANNTPVTVMGDDRQPYYTSRLDAITNRRAPVMSKDQVEAGILQRNVAPQGMAPPPPQGAPQPGPQVAGPSMAPPVAPTAQPGPYNGLHPDVIGMIGGQGAVERDRDRRLLGQIQSSNLPPEPTGRSQAQADVENTSGLWTGLGKAGAETLGTLFNTDLNPGLTQATQGARDRATRTTAALAGANNLPAGVKTLHSEGTNVPGPGIFGLSGLNAGTEGNRAVQLPRDLRTQWSLLKTFAADPNITPADREKAYGHMMAIQRIIEDWEAPTAGAHAAGAAPAPQQPQPTPAPQQAAAAGGRPRAVNPKTGQTIEWNGQAWVPM